MRRGIVDFTAVRPEHRDVHSKLENWGRCYRDRQSKGRGSPMFRYYRSAARARAYASLSASPIDRAGAEDMQSSVAALPAPHSVALSWYYIRNGANPRGAAVVLGLSKAGLAALVDDARQMILNREG